MPQVPVNNLGGVGIIKDLPTHRLPKNGWTDSNHVRFDIAGARQLNSERQVLSPNDPTISNITWIYQFPTTASPLWAYSNLDSGAVDGDVFAIDAGTPNTHTKITRTGTDYSTTTAERPHGGTFHGSGFWNNTVDIPQWWSPMTVGTLLVDMPNWATHDEGSSMRCKFMRAYKNFLMIGNLTAGSQFPYRLRWSNAAVPGTAPTTWSITDASALGGDFDLAETPGYIVDGLTLGEIFVVYKERSTIGVQFVGGNQVMRQWTIFEDSGILWRDCVAAFPKGHLVATQDDIITHTGVKGSETSILENKIRRWLFNRIDPTVYTNCFMVRNTPRKEIWFCYPVSPSTFATDVVIWNWETGSLGTRTLPAGGVPFASAGSVVTQESEPITWGV